MSNKFGREQRINRNLTIAVCVLGAVCLGLIILSNNLSRTVTVEVMPDTGSIQSIQSGETQPHNAFGIATLVLLGLNTWNEDGESEYEENILRYRPFIDNQFLEWLVSDYRSRKQGNNINELKFRTRRLTMTEQFYQPAMVKAVGAGTFEVTLELEVQEKIGDLLVKHFKGKFKVNVARQAAPRNVNPWQLKVVGRPLEIERLETFL